jgi:prepilin-type processing-associated H-X9-DG protein
LPAGVVVPQHDPGEVIRSFVAALNRNDMKTASTLVIGGQKGAALELAQAEMKKALGAFTYEVREINLHATNAPQQIATMKIRLRLKDSLNNKITHDERLNLRQEGTLWKIVPLSAQEMNDSVYQNGESDILENFASYLASPRIIIEIRAQKCMAHLKQLALGAFQLANDNGEKWAFNNRDFAKMLLPYTHNEEILLCPLEPQGNSYSFNSQLSNVAQAKVAQPALTVLFYEGKDEKLNFRHDNRAGVCFADGHVELVTPERAKTLKWNP